MTRMGFKKFHIMEAYVFLNFHISSVSERAMYCNYLFLWWDSKRLKLSLIYDSRFSESKFYMKPVKWYIQNKILMKRTELYHLKQSGRNSWGKDSNIDTQSINILHQDGSLLFILLRQFSKRNRRVTRIVSNSNFSGLRAIYYLLASDKNMCMCVVLYVLHSQRRYIR